MGNSPSGDKSGVLELDRIDILLTPSCSIDNGVLESEWLLFLTLPIFTHAKVNIKPLRKLKKKKQWFILCKYQREIAKRFRQDAEIAFKMNLLAEATALFQASLTIHSVVTNSKADVSELERSFRMCEQSLIEEPNSKRRNNSPLPEQKDLEIVFENFLRRANFLLCIRMKLRKLSSQHQHSLVLYEEYLESSSFAQQLADDAFEIGDIEASAQFYRAAVRLYESDSLVEALQSACDEVEYERFVLLLKKRDQKRIQNESTNAVTVKDEDKLIVPNVKGFHASLTGLPEGLRNMMKDIVPEACMHHVERFMKECSPNNDAVVNCEDGVGRVSRAKGKKKLIGKSSSLGKIFSSVSGTKISRYLSSSAKNLHGLTGSVSNPPVIESIDVTPNQNSNVSTSQMIKELQEKLKLQHDNFLPGQRCQPKSLTVKRRRGFKPDSRETRNDEASVDQSAVSNSISPAANNNENRDLEHVTLSRPITAVRTKRRPKERIAFAP